MSRHSFRAFFGDILRINTSFVIRNVFAWLCFCATLTAMNQLMNNRDLGRELVSNLGLFFCGIIGTQLVRIIILSAGENAPWKSIYFHAFVIGVPLSSFLMTVQAIEFHALFIYSIWPEHDFSLMKGLFGLWFFMCLLFSGWTGVYVSALAVKRSNRAEVERLETETALRDAELRALKAQINPHFLFNSLNTIRALVNEHPERAQEAVLHLSLMLRASLQSERMLRSLRDELETTHHYLELEKMRFEERLNVVTEVSQAAMEVMVPTMILQTLVENAVKHGIGTTVKGGVIRIEGHVENGRVIVTLSNPGHLHTASESTGLGVHNARTRLQRMIGEDARLDISESEGIVTARLNLPIKRDDKGAIG